MAHSNSAAPSPGPSDKAASGRTGRIARLVLASMASDLPAPVLEKAKHHVLDTLGAMISGTELAAGRAAVAYVRDIAGAPLATVVGSGLRTSPTDAALANAMAAHADET